MNFDMSDSVTRQSHAIAETDQNEALNSSAKIDSTSQQVSGTESKDDNEDVADIDLKDPELEKVALKMQSKFRFKKK